MNKEIEIIYKSYASGTIDLNTFVEAMAEYKDVEPSQEEVDEIYTTDLLRKDVERVDTGLVTGYSYLDNFIRIPVSALTIIAGRPSHGKTTMLMNIMMRMIMNYSDKKFFFFSYEEPQSQIALKLINLIASEVLSEYSNVRAIQGYVKNGFSDNSNINNAMKVYDQLAKNRNVSIYAKSYDVEELCVKIRQLVEEHDVGAIFIDYIQKIRTKRNFNSRQLEVQYVSNEILKVAKDCGIAIILGCQLGRGGQNAHKIRLDNMRESGDIEQDANLVLAIFNPTMEKEHEAYQNGVQTQYERCVPFRVTILKNRDGVVGNEIFLEFDRPLNKIVNPKIGVQNESND